MKTCPYVSNSMRKARAIAENLLNTKWEINAYLVYGKLSNLEGSINNEYLRCEPYIWDSSVSNAVARVKAKLQKDRKFKDRLEHIESNILKGQA